MIKQLSLIFAALLLLGYLELSHQFWVKSNARSPCWTKWYNRDGPNGTGDWETLSNLRDENPNEICPKPLKIEVVTADKEIPAKKTGQKFHVYGAHKGFVCLNKDQKSGKCLDYKVRFKCACRSGPKLYCCE